MSTAATFHSLLQVRHTVNNCLVEFIYLFTTDDNLEWQKSKLANAYDRKSSSEVQGFWMPYSEVSAFNNDEICLTTSEILHNVEQGTIFLGNCSFG